MKRPSRATVRQEFWWFVQIFGLCGLVFARPVLAAFGESPETFLEAGASARSIVVFGVLWILGPPIMIWSATALTRVVGSKLRRWSHVLAVAILVGVFVAQWLTQSTEWARVIAWGLAVVAAGVGAWLWLRSHNMRLFLQYLGVTPILFLALFLFFSPTADIIRGSNIDVATSGIDVPILFVVLDELPTASLLDETGHIDPEVFPGFARLASTGTWYRNHTTVGATTGRAVPAILTGQMPDREAAAPVASVFPDNLFTLLGTNYRFHVDESITSMCPARLCGTAEDRGLGLLLRPSADLWMRRFDRMPVAPETVYLLDARDDDRTKRLQSFADKVGASPGARIDYDHVILPHAPWRILPSGRKYDKGTENGVSPYDYSWVDDESARVGRQRHLLQLQNVDRQLDELFDELIASGKFDETLIVVTADHGGAFSGGQPIRATTAENVMQLAWSPLFIKAPGQQSGGIDDRNAQSIDVLPTIADILGVTVPWKLDGRSLLESPRSSDAKFLVPFAQNRAPTDDQGRIVLDSSRGLRQLLAFPPATRGTDAFAFLRTGKYGDLVGRDSADIGFGDPAVGRAELDEPSFDYDPTAGLVPTMVRAMVEVDEGRTVALLVNGVVAGIYRPGADQRVRFVVPETLMREGRNEPSIVLVEGQPGAETLRPLRGG